MACGDGCCGGSPPAKQEEKHLMTASSSRTTEQICGDEPKAKGGCCGNADAEKKDKPRSESVCAASCCDDASSVSESASDCAEKGFCAPKKQEKVEKSSCEDARCGGDAKSVKSDTSCIDGCCGDDAKSMISKTSCNDGCCGEGAAVAKSKPSCNDGGEDVKKTSSCKDDCCGIDEITVKPTSSCNDGCCGGGDTKTDAKGSCKDACCDDKAISSAKAKPKCADTTSCADSCCDERPKQTTHDIGEIDSRSISDSDVEKGNAHKEHVILSVSGMTCTGCETKLERTLKSLSSVSRLKTSLVLSRAEFDLNTNNNTVEDVIKHLERTTEFKCEHITNNGSSLDLICTDDPNVYMKGDWPTGVLDIKAIDKTIIRVNFDAKIIGARDLVGKAWDKPMSLAPYSADPTLKSGAKHVRHIGYMTLLAIVLTIPVLVLSWAPIPDKEHKEILFGSISLGFATVIQFMVAGPFYPKALKALLFSRVIEMDLLIVLSTSTAYIFSVVAFGYIVSGRPLSTGEFFETSTLLVTLIMVGRFVAALARQKAVESISIRSLQETTALLVREDGDEMIDTRLLQYGDVFKVSTDSRIPTDGTVISGESEVDESMLTGESRPIVKKKGSGVIAGSINGSGALTVRLTRIPGDNTISTIANMVDEAKLSKPKIQALADQVASYFVPVVVFLTISVFCIWIAIGMTKQNKSGSEATIQALTYAITVLIVSCPCAIGLAVPMVIVVATGVAAERGVIFKSAEAIEIAWKTTHAVFDKTGTLTQGTLSVHKKDVLDKSSEKFKLSLLLGLIASSKHPVSVAVAAHLKESGVSPVSISSPKNVVGKGVEATFAGRTLRAGNSTWLNCSEHSIVQSALTSGCTAFCFTINDELKAVFALKDVLRDDTQHTISTLQKRGIEVHVLSGDDDGAVRAITSQLGISDVNVHSRCTPASKRDYINRLLATPASSKHSRFSRSRTKQGEKPTVLFIGDGTNDAPALAASTIGIHMSSSSGTDVSASAASVVLTSPSLACLLTTIAVSRKAVYRIAFNFGWSFVYNLFAVLLAAGAFVGAGGGKGVRIPPEYAGLGELVSVLPVVAVGVGLRWAKF